jgi:hypothetical protein
MPAHIDGGRARGECDPAPTRLAAFADPPLRLGMERPAPGAVWGARGCRTEGMDLTILGCNLQLETERLQHLEHGGELRIAVLRKSLVQTFPSEPAAFAIRAMPLARATSPKAAATKAGSPSSNTASR